MNDADLLITALSFASEAHKDQLDKNGHPYLDHPVQVAALVKGADGSPTAIAAALLHDVVEDTDATLDELAEVFPEAVVALVDALTRRDGERYFDYIRRIRASGADAILVKQADLAHNSDPKRAFPGSESLATRYAKARSILRGDLA